MERIRDSIDMRVMILNGNVSGGGAAQIAHAIYEGEKENGLEVFFVAGWGKKEQSADLVIGKNICLKIMHAIRREIHGGVCYSNPYAVRKILDFIDRNKIDLVHIHNIANNYIGIKDVAVIASKYPVVWTLHEMWSFTGHCGHSFECEEWKTGCLKCKNLRFLPQINRNCTAKVWKEKRRSFTNKNICFVTPSKWLENKVRKSFLKNEKIITINNGIEFGSITKKYSCDSDNVLKILFVAGNINNPYKGLDIVEKALEIVDVPQCIKINIMGEGRLSDRINDKYSITYYGLVSEKEKKEEVYASSDLLLIPSKQENFPTVILEAFACGLPAIGSNVGGISEIITEDCGWVMKENTPDELSNILKNILKDRRSLKIKGENCSKRFKEEYQLHKMINAYVNLYREVLDNV